MSRAAAPPGRSPILLALIVSIAGFELCVGWLVLHPQVSADYRAYYIDQTTTCLDKGTSGKYPLGQTVSFLPDDVPGASRLRVCGWDGPVGDGTHSVGTKSMLRFAVAAPAGDLILRLQMAAIIVKDGRQQRIVVSGNGISLGEVTIAPGVTESIDFAVPESVVAAGPGRVDIVLDYPDAAEMVPHDSDIHLRAIKLLSAQLRRPGDTPSSGPQDDPDAKRFRAEQG